MYPRDGDPRYVGMIFRFLEHLGEHPPVIGVTPLPDRFYTPLVSHIFQTFLAVPPVVFGRLETLDTVALRHTI